VAAARRLCAGTWFLECLRPASRNTRFASWWSLSLWQTYLSWKQAGAVAACSAGQGPQWHAVASAWATAQLHRSPAADTGAMTKLRATQCAFPEPETRRVRFMGDLFLCRDGPQSSPYTGETTAFTAQTTPRATEDSGVITRVLSSQNTSQNGVWFRSG